jgi:RNA polymerase sigma-70 factor (ECF subfamily)
MQTDAKSANAIANDRIQELAARVADKKNKNVRRDMNDLMVMIMPKLRFYVWGFMNSEDDTDDVLYNALEKICINIGTYNPAYRFTTWAFTIAKNEALTWLNKMRPENEDIDDHFYKIANMLIDDTEDVMEREVHRENILVEVYREIQRISVDEDNLMMLEKDINRRKGKDIAEQYGISENTVKTRIRAGRRRVREHVLQVYPELQSRRIILEL